MGIAAVPDFNVSIPYKVTEVPQGPYNTVTIYCEDGTVHTENVSKGNFMAPAEESRLLAAARRVVPGLVVFNQPYVPTEKA